MACFGACLCCFVLHKLAPKSLSIGVMFKRRCLFIFAAAAAGVRNGGVLACGLQPAARRHGQNLLDRKVGGGRHCGGGGGGW